MTTEDPVREAMTQLERRRNEVEAELSRLSQAIAALEALSPAAGAGPSTRRANTPSVRTMAVRLMEEADRDWSAGEILDAYRKRGTPVHGKDPSNALRAALADAKKRGWIISTGVGRYQHAKWAKRPADAASPQDAAYSAASTPSYDPQPRSVTVHSVAGRVIQGVVP